MERAFSCSPRAASTLIDKVSVTALRKEEHIAYVKEECSVLITGFIIELPTENIVVIHCVTVISFV